MSETTSPPIKPLGQKAYGSIPHLPGSRRGPADKGLSESQARICTHQTRDRHDVIIVLEKLDGSCCSVAKLDGKIIPLVRAGYHAETSPFEQHSLFANWVDLHEPAFDQLLSEGERCVGEWLAQAHGTRYDLTNHEPFVIFDLMRGHNRLTWDELTRRTSAFETPRVLFMGHRAFSIEEALERLTVSGHGALDAVEGAVWRVERWGDSPRVDFLAKYVRPEKVDGCYLPEKTGHPAIWNWRPQCCPVFHPRHSASSAVEHQPLP